MTVITKEILLYHNVPHSKYRWITTFSLFSIGMISVNLFLLATPKLMDERAEAIKNKYRQRETKPEEVGTEAEIEQWELNPGYNPETLGTKIKKSLSKDIFTWSNLKNNISERPAMSAAMIGSVGLVYGLFTFYAHRMVHKIFLLPKDRVKFQLFNVLPFSKPRNLELPLTDVSCKASRKSSHNYSLLRVRNHWGYFLVHKSEGEFLEPKLYDEYLGYERSWDAKKE